MKSDLAHQKRRSDDAKKLIQHYHYTAWPDFGAPYHDDELIKLVHAVKRNLNKDGNKIIVHCR